MILYSPRSITDCTIQTVISHIPYRLYNEKEYNILDKYTSESLQTLEAEEIT